MRLMKKHFFLKKLDLFNISLEVLTTFNENQQIIKKFHNLYYSIRYKNYNKKQNFIVLIKYIKSILTIVEIYSLNTLAETIIQNNNKYRIKYISKFCYLYNKNKKYYINHKLLLYRSHETKTITMTNNAILNLYVICQLRNTRGLYTLIKYLKE